MCRVLYYGAYGNWSVATNPCSLHLRIYNTFSNPKIHSYLSDLEILHVHFLALDLATSRCTLITLPGRYTNVLIYDNFATERPFRNIFLSMHFGISALS